MFKVRRIIVGLFILASGASVLAQDDHADWRDAWNARRGQTDAVSYQAKGMERVWKAGASEAAARMPLSIEVLLRCDQSKFRFELLHEEFAERI